MTEVEHTWLGLVGVSAMWMRMIDGKPLAISGVSKDADAGYGRGAGGMQKGYKFHAVWGSGPLPITGVWMSARRNSTLICCSM